ncbi:MAG TPA: TonB-dependent receptor, partial [Saprospiraceae bacterium]|nr:TonB-dependent receptor [Saprospiraceae bacterium]
NYISNNNSNNQQNKSNLFYGEYQIQRQFQPLDLVLTAGVTETYSKVDAELYGDTSYHVNNTGLYIQADHKFGDRLKLSFGARYEFNAIYSPEIVGNDTIPGGVDKEAKPVFRVGLNYKLGEGTFLRASWGQGYRFPTIAEKFISTQFSNFPVLPNPKLKSETGWSAELGLKQGFKISEWYGFADISGFWTEYKDMMEFTFLGINGFQSRNIGNTVVKGFDINFAADGRLWGMPTTLLAGYTYIDPKFKNYTRDDSISSSANFNILKYRFKHTVKFDMETQYRGFSFGVSCIYNSNMEAIDQVFNIFISGVKDFRATHPDGFTIFGFRLGYSFNNGLKTTILLNNILNTEYTWRPARLEAPRNISLRLEYNVN